MSSTPVVRKAELRGQGAGNQGNIVGKTGLQYRWTKPGSTSRFRPCDIADPFCRQYFLLPAPCRAIRLSHHRRARHSHQERHRFTGNEASIFVGSFDTVMESFERGGVVGQLSYYVSQSYLHNGIGIENPTRSANPIHDDTDQEKLFTYNSYIIDDTSRISLLVGANHSDFEIPNNPGQTPVFTVGRRSSFNSARLDENQAEQIPTKFSPTRKRPMILVSRHRSSVATARFCFVRQCGRFDF